jgi:hypothetical protein
MTYVVLLWMSPSDETEVRCFSELAKALDYAADAREATIDSGGDLQAWAWNGKRQVDIDSIGWLQDRKGRHQFAAQWLKWQRSKGKKK